MASNEDPFATPGTGEVDDPWGSPVAPPSISPPKMKQLGAGHTERTRIYDKGGDKEQPRKTKGRTVLISLENASFQDSVPSPFKDTSGNTIMQCKGTYDIVVLDGEPISEVLDKDGDVVGTYDEPKVAPFELTKFYSSHKLLYGQLKDMKARGLKYALGVIGQLPAQGQNAKPWVLLAPEAEDADLARKYLANRPAPVDPF